MLSVSVIPGGRRSLAILALLIVAIMATGARAAPDSEPEDLIPLSPPPVERSPELTPAQTEPETTPATQLYFDADAVDADRLAGFFLPEGADDWELFVPSIVAPGQVEVIQVDAGELRLTELSLLPQPLRSRFSTVVFPGIRTVAAADLAGLFPEGFLGVWRFNPLSQTFDVFRKDGPELLNSLEEVAPGDALFVLHEGAPDTFAAPTYVPGERRISVA